MAIGHTWQTASCMMSRTVKVNEDGLTLGDLTHLKSFQLTSSHKNRTTKVSVLPNLDIVMYGGQFVDKIITSGEVITIKGTVTENLNDSDIDITRHPVEDMHYAEFQVPDGWNDGSHLVQQGEIPTSRTGHCFTKFKVSDGSIQILCSGDHSKSSIVKPFFHPDYSFNIFKVPQMLWIQLETKDSFKRSFHAQYVNSHGEIIIVGGKTLINSLWSKVHPISAVLIVNINADFSYQVRAITIQTDVE